MIRLGALGVEPLLLQAEMGLSRPAAPQLAADSAASESALKFPPLPKGVGAKEKVLLNYHRRNLAEGTFLDDEEGLTTVFITGVTGPDGRIYNVPGYANGRRLEPEEAAARAAKVGWGNFPSYETGEESNRAAQRLHKIIEADGELFRRQRSGGRRK